MNKLKIRKKRERGKEEEQKENSDVTFKSCFIPVNEIFELTEVENTSVNSIVVLVNAMWKHYLKALFLFLVLEKNIFLCYYCCL